MAARRMFPLTVVFTVLAVAGCGGTQSVVAPHTAGHAAGPVEVVFAGSGHAHHGRPVRGTSHRHAADHARHDGTVSRAADGHGEHGMPPSRPSASPPDHRRTRQVTSSAALVPRKRVPPIHHHNTGPIPLATPSSMPLPHSTQKLVSALCRRVLQGSSGRSGRMLSNLRAGLLHIHATGTARIGVLRFLALLGGVSSKLTAGEARRAIAAAAEEAGVHGCRTHSG